MFLFFLCVCVVLEFELRASTLSHSTSPIFVKGFFEIGFHELFARLALNLDPPDLCLLSSQDYRYEPPCSWNQVGVVSFGVETSR
jgi:hypothetical protein